MAWCLHWLTLFQVGIRQSAQIPPDIRAYSQALLTSLPSQVLIPYIYPTFYSLHNMPPDVSFFCVFLRSVFWPILMSLSRLGQSANTVSFYHLHFPWHLKDWKDMVCSWLRTDRPSFCGLDAMQSLNLFRMCLICHVTMSSAEGRCASGNVSYLRLSLTCFKFHRQLSVLSITHFLYASTLWFRKSERCDGASITLIFIS